MGNIHKLQRGLLPLTHSKTVQEVPAFSRPGSNLPVQSTAIWSVHSTNGIHGSGKGGETDWITRGYKNPEVLDHWLFRARSHQTRLQHIQTLAEIC